MSNNTGCLSYVIVAFIIIYLVQDPLYRLLVLIGFFILYIFYINPKIENYNKEKENLKKQLPQNQLEKQIKFDIDNYGEIRTKINIKRSLLFQSIIRMYPEMTITWSSNIVNNYLGEPKAEEICPPPPIKNVIPTTTKAPHLITSEVISKMSWREFEQFIELIFKNNGYSTILTPPRWDEGKDIIATKDGITYFIECKHYSKEVIGREFLQKLVGAAIPYNVKHLIFITTSRYHDNAYEYARKINNTNNMHIQLWDMNKILEVANSQ